MKAPAFQFYADDFIGGTVCFTAEDVGAYMRLLCFQWGNGALPAKKELLDRIAGCVVSDDVMAKFPEGKNPRMERERLKQAAYRAERSESGKKGAKSKWANGSANGSAYSNSIACHNHSKIREPKTSVAARVSGQRPPVEGGGLARHTRG